MATAALLRVVGACGVRRTVPGQLLTPAAVPSQFRGKKHQKSAKVKVKDSRREAMKEYLKKMEREKVMQEAGAARSQARRSAGSGDAESRQKTGTRGGPGGGERAAIPSGEGVQPTPHGAAQGGADAAAGDGTRPAAGAARAAARVPPALPSGPGAEQRSLSVQSLRPHDHAPHPRLHPTRPGGVTRPCLTDGFSRR